MPITLTSPAFAEGELIPDRYTCDDADLSPPLAWSGVPEGTRSLALVCEDPGVPHGTWIHWLLYGLSPNAQHLPEWIPAQAQLDDGTRQGTNDFGTVGYSGPCAQNATHRYLITLYAFDVVPSLAPGASSADLYTAMEGHILDTGRLNFTYATNI